MRPGTRVTVKLTDVVGTVKGADKHGRVAVEVEGAIAKHLPKDLELYDPRPKVLRDAESRAMAGASFDFSGPTQGKVRGRKRHRFAKRAEQLTTDQLAVLVRLLEGDAVLCTVGGRSYAVSRVPLGWMVRGLEASDTEHTVLEDLSACSCQDNRFRGRRCKHLEAVTRATTV